MLMLRMFNLMPFVMIGCTILGIIGFCTKKKLLIYIAGGIGFLFVFSLMGIAVPIMFIGSVFEDATGFLWMLSIVVFVWLCVSLFINFKNRITFLKHKESGIYVRDINVEYSPAVCSYLMNNKIETAKDLSATLLNLCAKNIVKIEKQEDGKINIIDLKNAKQVEKLKPDEQYAYEMFTTKVASSKINAWKNKVEDEYRKYRFSKENEKPLGQYIFFGYIAFFVCIFIYFIVSGNATVSGKPAEIIIKLMVSIFMAAWEMILINGAVNFIKMVFNRNSSSEFKDSYTAKGAKEFTRWGKFIKFMEDYSLIDEKEHESVILWGKYLSYSIALGINKKCDKELYNKIKKEFSFDYDIFSNLIEKEEF